MPWSRKIPPPATFFLESVRQKLPEIENLVAFPEDSFYLARLRLGPVIFLPNTGDPIATVKLLGLILKKYSIEGKSLKKVDYDSKTLW